MNCKRCGKPLPSRGVTCKFCGTLMDKEQIDFQKRMNDRHAEKIELLSEKYGHENKVQYRNNKENKILGLIVIMVVLLILIILTILVNVLN